MPSFNSLSLTSLSIICPRRFKQSSWIKDAAKKRVKLAVKRLIQLLWTNPGSRPLNKQVKHFKQSKHQKPKGRKGIYSPRCNKAEGFRHIAAKFLFPREQTFCSSKILIFSNPGNSHKVPNKDQAFYTTINDTRLTMQAKENYSIEGPKHAFSNFWRSPG